MYEYHKIQSIFKRDPVTKYRTLLMNEYSLPEFEYLANNIWEFTEKVDGTNIRISTKDSHLVIQGRTKRAQIPTFLLDTLMEIFDPEQLASVFNYENRAADDDEDIYLYGEGYGTKIQKGGDNYKADGTSFVLFDIRVGHWWLKREDVEGIAKTLNIDVVPIIGQGTLDDMVAMTQQGFTSTWGNFVAEGIVARPKVELKSRNGQRIITKIKTKDFV